MKNNTSISYKFFIFKFIKHILLTLLSISIVIISIVFFRSEREILESLPLRDFKELTKFDNGYVKVKVDKELSQDVQVIFDRCKDVKCNNYLDTIEFKDLLYGKLSYERYEPFFQGDQVSGRWVTPYGESKTAVFQYLDLSIEIMPYQMNLKNINSQSFDNVKIPDLEEVKMPKSGETSHEGVEFGANKTTVEYLPINQVEEMYVFGDIKGGVIKGDKFIGLTNGSLDDLYELTSSQKPSAFYNSIGLSIIIMIYVVYDILKSQKIHLFKFSKS